jgi:hypothetical protein
MNLKNPYTFLFIIFVVSAVADIALNDLTKTQLGRTSRIITSLLDYFKGKLIIESAVYAGITVVVATMILMSITTHLLGFMVPSNWSQLGTAMIIAYVIGYGLDVAIEQLKVFGSSLDHYYRVAGAGHWGAFSFEVALVASFLVQQYLLPALIR